MSVNKTLEILAGSQTCAHAMLFVLLVHLGIQREERKCWVSAVTLRIHFNPQTIYHKVIAIYMSFEQVVSRRIRHFRPH